MPGHSSLFFQKSPDCGIIRNLKKRNRRARVSSVLRTEPFRQLRILPEIPGRSGPPSVCSVQSGKRAPIVWFDPMLVRSDLGNTGHSSTISRILYTMLQKKAIVFVKKFPTRKESTPRRKPAAQLTASCGLFYSVYLIWELCCHFSAAVFPDAKKQIRRKTGSVKSAFYSSFAGSDAGSAGAAFGSILP